MNEVVSRNGGWGCYAGTRAHRCIQRTSTIGLEPLIQGQKRASARLLCVLLTSRPWKGTDWNEKLGNHLEATAQRVL